MGNEIIFDDDVVKIVYSLEEDRYYTNNYSKALGFLSIPLTACFHIGYKCNLKCPFCLSPFETIENNKINYTSICNFIKSNKIMRVVISGGEPLLYLDELPVMLKNLKKLGCHTIVSTNGTLPFKNIENYLDLIDWFDISLPATNRDLYCQIRGDDYFERVITFIQELITTGRRVRLSYMVSENNLHDVKRFPLLAVSLGIKNIRITHTYQSRTGELIQLFLYEELCQRRCKNVCFRRLNFVGLWRLRGTGFSPTTSTVIH